MPRRNGRREEARMNFCDFLKKVFRFLNMAQVEHRKISLIFLFGPAASCAVPR